MYFAKMIFPLIHFIELRFIRLRSIVGQITVVRSFFHIPHPAAQGPFPIGDGQGFFQHFGVGDAGPGGGDLLQAVFQRLDLRRSGVIRAEDGNFYLYATESGKNNIPILRSSDLVNWTKVG